MVRRNRLLGRLARITPMQPVAPPIPMLLEHHGILNELFSRHQTALVERQWASATSLLLDYEQRLASHFDLEERVLLSRCDPSIPLRWSTSIYTAEHRRITRLVRDAIGRLEGARAVEITSRTLIGLIDAEGPLKRLVEHHQEREEIGLFAELLRSQSRR